MSVCYAILNDMFQRGVTARVDAETLRLKPREALDDDLLARIKANKPEIIRILATIPPMPEGVRLVHWEPKPAPIILTPYSVVTGVDRFVRMTLLELKAALVGNRWQSGHWSVRELVHRLEVCGVRVQTVDMDLHVQEDKF
jgi:TubC N-terminal docking domain